MVKAVALPRGYTLKYKRVEVTKNPIAYILLLKGLISMTSCLVIQLTRRLTVTNVKLVIKSLSLTNKSAV